MLKKKLQNGIGKQDWNGSLLAVLIARTLDFHWLGNNRFFCFDLIGKGEEEYAHYLGKKIHEHKLKFFCVWVQKRAKTVPMGAVSK
jgi:hypothetical protein